MTSERSGRQLTEEEIARIQQLYGDEDSKGSEEGAVVLPLIHTDEEMARRISTGVEEVVEWGHTLTLAIGEREGWDPSGERVARLVLSDGTVSYHGSGGTAEEALSSLLNPETRISGDRSVDEVSATSSDLGRVYRSRALPSSRLDLMLQTHRLSVGVSTESGSITTTLVSRQGGVSRGSGENFPAALQFALNGIRGS